MAKNYTGYELSRAWFDWCFENPEKITPNHTALFFFAIEHSNRLGWKEKFGFPMEMAKNAIGIKNYRTYANTFNDLVDWGFFIMHEKSKNQWSANIIAIAKNTQANAEANTVAPTKALDKAIQKHSQKQRTGSVGIDKQIQNNTITNNKEEDPLLILQKLLSPKQLELGAMACKTTLEAFTAYATGKAGLLLATTDGKYSVQTLSKIIIQDFEAVRKTYEFKTKPKTADDFW